MSFEIKYIYYRHIFFNKPGTLTTTFLVTYTSLLVAVFKTKNPVKGRGLCIVPGRNT